MAKIIMELFEKREEFDLPGGQSGCIAERKIASSGDSLVEEQFQALEANRDPRQPGDSLAGRVRYHGFQCGGVGPVAVSAGTECECQRR
jgi:hypothetical protein